jgi:hypothetical protein
LQSKLALQSKSYSHLPFLIFKIALFCLIITLPWSRAITSISTGLIFLTGIWEHFYNKIRIPKNVSYLFLLAFIFLCAIDVWRADSVSEWFSYFNIKLPLILVPFAVIVFGDQINEKLKENISISFCIAITSATIASTINYIQHYHELTALVLQSKPIPIMGEIHHITFSVYCAFSIIVSAYYAYHHKLRWLWLFTIINLVGLHVLTARTGLVGFYFACFFLGIIYILKYKIKIRYLVIGVTAIGFLPIIAFYTLSGFHNRILNSWEDVKVIWNDKDVNYQSMGMRIEASKTAFDIVKRNPIMGIGLSNIKQAMSKQYEDNHSKLYIENRILPHNQFVIEAAIHGIIGLVVLLLFFISPFFTKLGQLSPLFLAFWALIFFACMFECLLDRQHGVILVSIFWFLYLKRDTDIL